MRLGPAAAAAAVLVLGGCSAEGTERAERAPEPVRVEASIGEWRWAPGPAEEPRRERRAAAAEPAPEPEPAPEREPAAAAAAPEADDEPAPPADLPPLAEPSADGPADTSLVRAEVLRNGIALPPLEAPPEVRAIFEAGNVIARSPYKWGGGHGKWQDTGYDCSGSVSYALAAAGLLDAPLASGPLMSWGRPGKGKWVTIYSNPGHVFLVVAGVRFDTVARRSGSRWTNAMTSTAGYVARHPPGL
jgi:hypothetical protein